MVRFYALPEGSQAIAVAMHPQDEESRRIAAAFYHESIWRAICAGTLIGRRAETRYPIDPTLSSSLLQIGGCIVSADDLNAWLQSLGVGVQVGIDQPIDRKRESNEECGARITKRRNVLKSEGHRDFIKKIAAEENLSVSRIRQILDEHKARIAARGSAPAGWVSSVHRA